MRLFGFIAAIIVAGLFVAPPQRASADPIVMKIGTATLNDTQHEWMKRYKAAVERDSKGRIEVQLYRPANSDRFRARSRERNSVRSKAGWARRNFSTASTNATKC